VQVTGADATKWPGFTYNNSGGWAVQLLNINDITRDIGLVQTHVVTSGQTLAFIALQFYEQFRTYINRYQDVLVGQGNASNAKILYGFNLYMTDINPPPSDTGSNTTAIYKGQILFEDEYVHFGSTNELKLQNRSVNADGGKDTDVVDSNPIQGQVISFNGLPRGRDPDLAVLKRTNEQTGVRTFKSTDFGAARGMREPPNRKLFVNSKKSTKIMIAPGAIEFVKWKYSKSMKLFSYLKSIHLNTDNETITSSNYGMNDVKGTSIMVALEDVLNFSSTYEITVTFELDRKYGCFCTTNKKKAVIPTWESNLET